MGVVSALFVLRSEDKAKAEVGAAADVAGEEVSVEPSVWVLSPLLLLRLEASAE